MKTIVKFSLIFALVFAPVLASASEVTGQISAGNSEARLGSETGGTFGGDNVTSGTSGSLSGTVSGGSGGGGGGGGSISILNTTGSGATDEAAVLGASTDVSNSPVTNQLYSLPHQSLTDQAGAVAIHTEGVIALGQGVQASDQPIAAVVVASGAGFGWWLWFFLLLALLVAVSAYWYRHYDMPTQYVDRY